MHQAITSNVFVKVGAIDPSDVYTSMNSSLFSDMSDAFTGWTPMEISMLFVFAIAVHLWTSRNK